MTDSADLVRRAQAGDVVAYGTLVERFRRMAVGYAESRLGDLHLAEDAAQEAFVHAFLAIGQLREAAAFPGWLRQIVSTYCNRLLRRPTHRVELADIETAVDGDQEEALHRQDLSLQLREAMARLPEAERIVTHLYYFEDLSQKDIASFLELPLTTVKYRLYASRQRLKPSLEGEFADMVKQTARPDRPGLATRVQDLLEALQALHERLADRLQAVLSEALEQDVDIRVDSVEQTTAGHFVSGLSNPCCTYAFRMAPLRGRALLDLPLDLASTLAGHHTPGPMTLAEYVLLIPTLKRVYRDIDVAWEGVGPIRATDIELETHPDFILTEAQAQNTVVHVVLAVGAGELNSAIHLAYETADLDRLRPYLGDGAPATETDLELPPEPTPAPTEAGGVTLVEVTPETRHVVGNMIPLWQHDQAAFGFWWSEPNAHGVLHPLPTAAHLTALSEHFTTSWFERPEVFRFLLALVEERPVGYTLVEAPPVAPQGIRYYLSGLFLHHAHRDAETVALVLRQLFDRWQGEWEAVAHPADRELQAALHGVLADYAGVTYRAGMGLSTVHGPRMMAFRFNNGEGA